MKLLITIKLSLLLITLNAFADKPAYEIYEDDGGNMSWNRVVNKAMDADVILFGEMHNNPIVHWLQLELTHELFQENDGKIVLGAEMFEADDQLILDEYLNGLYSSRNFEKEAKIWANYDTDYKPLVEFAKDSNLRFIATNIPRRYASFVAYNGLDSLFNLSTEAKSYIAELPVDYDPELPGYKEMADMGSGHGGGMMFIAEAQAVKDATMAYFINKNLEPNNKFIHFNGTYHSQNYEGINWYLKKINSELKILTIAAVQQEEIDDLEEDNEGLADVILVVPKNMTKTH